MFYLFENNGNMTHNIMLKTIFFFSNFIQYACVLISVKLTSISLILKYNLYLNNFNCYL